MPVFESKIPTCGRSRCERNEKYKEAEHEESAVKLVCPHFSSDYKLYAAYNFLRICCITLRRIFLGSHVSMVLLTELVA